MISKYQLGVISKLSPEKQDFVGKQLNIHHEGMLKNDMFMPANGKCYHCGVDLIEHEIESENDGSQLVTGCYKCFKSYCD